MRILFRMEIILEVKILNSNLMKYFYNLIKIIYKYFTDKFYNKLNKCLSNKLIISTNYFCFIYTTKYCFKEILLM